MSETKYTKMTDRERLRYIDEQIRIKKGIVKNATKKEK